jgi:CDP-diacylglycerol--serine O-phosphatidyltransferase
MSIKANIPNALTLLNLFSGCVALVFVSELKFDLAFYFVCLGIFFDFFDGFLARKFGVAGPLGVQLDSLADMVTSGVVPGYAMYQMLIGACNGNCSPEFSYIPFLGFIITLGACYRLANFNIDTRQSDSFIGLPTPANTLFIMSLALIGMVDQESFITTTVLTCNRYLLVISILSAYVMNAEIPLFSLKIKDFSVAKYKLQIGFLVLSILMIVLLQFLAVPLIIITYIVLSVISNSFSKK